MHNDIILKKIEGSPFTAATPALVTPPDEMKPESRRGGLRGVSPGVSPTMRRYI